MEKPSTFSNSNEACKYDLMRQGSQSVVDLGVAEYAEVHRLQLERQAMVVAGGEEKIFLVEHPPVYTCGRKTAEQDKPYWTGIAVIDVERGGELTYHGPGQIIGYPIINLQKRRLSVPRYLRSLENLLIEILTEFGVEAHYKEEHLAGLWVGEQKICSIGISLRHWVTCHGFALNVDCDLRPFLQTRPCGLDGNRIISLAALGFVISQKGLKEKITNKLEEVFF